MATYGREHLPGLVAGLGQSDSWDTLIPVVYGVSPAEFEVGWQLHREAWGHGYATEAGLALARWAFGQGIEQVIEISLTLEERAALQKSAAAVKELVDIIGV